MTTAVNPAGLQDTKQAPALAQTTVSQRRQSQFRVRPDLQLLPRNTEGEWVVKDPVSLEYFLFQADEVRVFQALRQPRTIPQLHRYLSERSGIPLTVSELTKFVQRLCTDNLAITCDGSNGDRLNQQAAHAARQKRWAALGGVLAIKLPGIAPPQWFDRLTPLSTLLFSTPALTVWIGFALMTLAWAGLVMPTLMARVPDLAWFTNPTHLLLLFLGYLFVKACHEMGHALACQYYGGTVRELGILLLFFSPCLYCDASDAWTIPSRWKRIMISLAGVYVEVLFSAGFFWLWWFNANPELAPWLFGMMLTTSVNTLFVNGNPLLKFDGYFALADYWEIPNLTTVSQEHLRQYIGQWYYQQTDSLTDGWQAKTIIYAGLSLVYRWMILVTILTAGYWILRSQGLETLGVWVSGLLAVVVLGVSMPKSIKQGWSNLMAPNKRWQAWLLTVLLLAIGGLWFERFPLERRVRTTAVLELAEPNALYAGRRGVLTPLVRPGTQVRAGQVVATIEDSDHKLKKAEFSRELGIVNKQLAGLRLNKQLVGEKTGEIEILEKRSERLSSELNEMRREEATAAVVADRDGWLFPPVQESNFGEVGTPSATRYDFESSKLAVDAPSILVEKGERLGLVADPQRLVAVMYVSPFEQQAIRPGQVAKFLVAANNEVLWGHVATLEPPRQLFSSDEGESRHVQPADFRVAITLPDSQSPVLRPGMHLPGLIQVESTTPRKWLWLEIRRWLIRMF